MTRVCGYQHTEQVKPSRSNRAAGEGVVALDFAKFLRNRDTDIIYLGVGRLRRRPPKGNGQAQRRLAAPPAARAARGNAGVSSWRWPTRASTGGYRGWRPPLSSESGGAMAHEADREGYIACELHNEAQYRLCSGVVARLRATTRAGGHRPNPFGLRPSGASWQRVSHTGVRIGASWSIATCNVHIALFARRSRFWAC